MAIYIRDDQIPIDFSPLFIAVSCCIEHNGKVLRLKRGAEDDIYPNTWGSPTGTRKYLKKENRWESIGEVIKREIFEETGIKLDVRRCEFFGTFNFRYEKYKKDGVNFDFIFYMYRYVIKSKCQPRVKLSNEHSSYMWIEPEDSLGLRLIEGEEEMTRIVYDILP